MTCGDTQVVIRTNQLLLISTREVRWQAEIPQVVIRTNALLLILTREVRCQAEIPQVVIRTHTVLLPRPVRSQVACGDALYDNSHTFRRRQCLHLKNFNILFPYAS